MAGINSRYRLSSSAFERPEEADRIDPKRVIVLAVEGDVTEKDYFSLLNDYLDTAILHIEVLCKKRGSGYNAPLQVVELLQEYLAVREGKLLPADVWEVFTEKYTRQMMSAYLEDPQQLDEQTLQNIRSDLLQIGIDLEYRRYLQNFNHETDFFAVVLDRDMKSHTRKELESCIQLCRKNGYGCFLSNPCFEFWLLLHLCDIEKEFSPDEQKQLLFNPKVSSRHTRVSREISRRARHQKHIPAPVFQSRYFPHIAAAIERSQKFASQFPELLDQLGTNLPELFREISFPLK